jgi:hypothetical protein
MTSLGSMIFGSVFIYCSVRLLRPYTPSELDGEALVDDYGSYGGLVLFIYMSFECAIPDLLLRWTGVIRKCLGGHSVECYICCNIATI